ncbi:MAG: transcription-repair coupling factor [Spirochaetes bacterium]|nr:transcription-repair coupling factor [Spirochaetota bacterium]
MILFENNKQAELFSSDLQFFLSDKEADTSIIFYPEMDLSPYENISDNHIIIERLKGYSRLFDKKRFIFVSSVRNVLMRSVPKNDLFEHIITLNTETAVSLGSFEQTLLSLGYNRTHKVIQQGTFTVRGDIIDLFPPNYNDPVRIELFDETVEDLRFFNILTQKSIQKTHMIQIYPAQEIILDRKNIDTFIEKIDLQMKELKDQKGEELWGKAVADKDRLSEIKEKVRNREFFSDIYSYFPFFLRKKESLLQSFSNSECTVFLPGFDQIAESYSIIHEQMDEFYKKRLSQRAFTPQPDEFLFNLKELEKIIGSHHHIFYNIMPFNVDDEVTLHVKGIMNFSGEPSRFLKFYRQKIKNGYHITFLSEYDESIEHLKMLLKKELKKDLNVEFVKGRISQGFEIDMLKEIFVQDFEFFGRIERDYTRTYRSKVLTQEVESVYDLAEGDYVVHLENGIGIYRGIKKIQSDKKVRDFFIIEYAQGMNLFLPLEKINLIHKYIGDDDNPPSLNKLGTSEFKRTKSKVEHSIISITKDLIRLYSIRKESRGYSFSKDTQWQGKLETSFEYVETPDQIRALQEIKTEMESSKPMDRLLCGDVGYGKTEVAIRVSFKSVMEGKQAAILVPTTILAQQHYNTFSDRLKDFPVRVEMISRFLNPKEQKKIIKDINDGKVDIIIGTHRLLSPDVKFKDIGLIIIDEEQRFGVAHKERLKMIRHIVDVLSMSATPIPRTLYMSLSGIRDISLIETPPEGRAPIDTKIEKFSAEEIRRAILLELERGGQVFFIHNRINSIYAMEDFLKRNVPEAKFRVVHGRMDSDELELAMLDFVEGNYDVLISTTIIESGIDMPNVNTIIINRADTFGLSQLYQLRGRVGRGLHKGYALLLYPGNRAITETAQKRLLTIYEYSDLGAGYQIALRDLEIRGAGNIFGPQQHGNIIAVGLELYSKILKKAVQSIKGEEVFDEIEVDLNFEYNAYIPDSYTRDNKIKIEIYKDLEKCRDFDRLELYAEELHDRFGLKMSKEMKNLFTVQQIKIICFRTGISAVNTHEVKTYEYVIQLVFKDTAMPLKRKIEEKLDSFRIYKNNLYLNIEKENFLNKLKKKLLLLI